MMINGNQLPKSIVEIVEAETKLLIEIKNINQRFETAQNLQNKQEIIAIANDGLEIEKRFKQHFAKKIILMTMLVSQNRKFYLN